MDKMAMTRANRMSELRALAAKMTRAQLDNEASVLGLKFIGDETREEQEFEVAEASVAAEEKAAAAAAAAKVAADEKGRREAFYNTKEGRAQRRIDELSARDDAIRKVNAGFVRSLPHSARMQGTHQPDDTGVVFPVPDGRYRVSGSGWVMTFAGSKWTSADAAHARSAPDWTEIPDVPGGKVSAKPNPKASGDD